MILFADNEGPDPRADLGIRCPRFRSSHPLFPTPPAPPTPPPPPHKKKQKKHSF